MFASLPFILLLILQGFARQDGAELLLSNSDLVNIPVQARSLKAFDGLFVHLSSVGKDQKNASGQQRDPESTENREIAHYSYRCSSKLQGGFLSIQRSRDGPIA